MITHHGQLLLRTNCSEGPKRVGLAKQLLLDLGDESVGGNDIGKPQIPDRVEHRGGKDRHILCSE
jgi:hypothetical protein